MADETLTKSTLTGRKFETPSLELTTVGSTEVRFTASKVTFICLTVFIVLVSIWILIANIMIISAPLVHKRLKKKTYMFISSLAAADLTSAFLVNTAWFMGVISVFNYNFYLSVKSNIYCAFIQSFYIFPMFCSVCNLFLVAIDRYIALVHPLKYDVVWTRTKGLILIVSAWIFAATVSSVNLFWNNPQPNGELICNAKDVSPGLLHYVIGPCFWFTCAAMFFMYLRIYYKIKTRNSSLRIHINNQNAAKSDTKAAKMLFITYTVFFFCWAPFLICLHLLMDSKVTMGVIYYPLGLAYLNSGMNFFIYSARCKQYQEAFQKMFYYIKCRRETRVNITLDSSESSGSQPSPPTWYVSNNSQEAKQ